MEFSMKFRQRIDDIERDRSLTAATRLQAHITCIMDEAMMRYLEDPIETDAALRRDGLAKTADRLIEIFGPGWWTKLQ